MLSGIAVDFATNNSDFHLRPAARQQQTHCLQLPLHRSSSGYNFATKQQQRAIQNDLHSRSPSNDRCGSANADNLSWTFFEQISSVDDHLRLAESDVNHCPSDDGHSTAPIVNDVHSKVHDGRRPAFGDERQPLTNANITNGLTTKKKLAVDFNSEQSPDLLLPRKQQHRRTNSTITTKIVERNQDVQSVHQPEYSTTKNNQRGPSNTKNNSTKENNNNNSIKSLQQRTKNHLTSNTESAFQNHDPANVMITDVYEGATGGTSVVTGSGTAPRTTRIRHLPVITKQPPAVHAEGVDLVGNANPSTRRPKPREPSTLRRMGAATKSSLGSHSFVEGFESQLGLIGWRKKCLYLLLVLLILLIIVNLALTLWILKVMEFTTEGMGQLKIIPGGIQLTGQALILDMLRASTIRSRHGQPISIESSRNFSINTRDTNGVLENHLFLGHDKLECLATGFRINDTTGRNLFSVNRDEVTIGAHALRIDGEGGAIFRESIQTPHVRAEPGRELRLESPTRQLELTAAKDMNLQSRAGGIELTALEDVKLSALEGSIRLESSKILMPNLRTVQPALPGAAPNRDHTHRVFQLCACANGKLFLAAPHSICAGDDSTVCR